jgi:hypothetical protein
LTRAAAVLLLLSACSSEEPKAAQPECTINAFRACETDACRGVQQCVELGEWSECECVVTDASFPEASTDASSDADASSNADASSDADAEALTDASSPDASTDANAEVGADATDSS